MSRKETFSTPQLSDQSDEDEESSSDDEFQPTGSSRGGARPVPQPRGGGGSSVAKLPIQIRTMDGKTYKIDAKTDWDVQMLKDEFEKWHGGNAAMCSLYFKAKKLQDNNTLLSYKIGAGDFVMANYRSVGGFPFYVA